ncbi:MAG: glycosyltransferase [Saprospiraceae bacterium]|nr:glycosyltransferase [Saprospiraceae bacterium]
MHILYLIPVLFTLVYCILIVYYLYYWKKIQPPGPTNSGTNPFVSIVIAARNEEATILDCITSCLKQNYPAHLFEVIVVDDQSEDDTYEILETIEDPKFVMMRLGVYKRTTIKGSKKKAIAYGINHAKGEIICTTDADGIVPENWVLSMVSYFNHQKIKLVSGPVGIMQSNNFLNYFQALDFSGNGLINAAGLRSKIHHLCNAANLAYRKHIFLEEDAFENNYNIPSGDDVFLIHKIKENYPDGIAFAKTTEAIIKTHALKDWSSFFKQRLRWAGKMSLMKDWSLKWIPTWVWLQRVSIIVFLILGIILKDLNLILITGSCWFIYWLADFILQYDACRFYNIKKWQIWFFPVALFHSFYFILIGILSWLPITTDWKGRRV